MQSGRSTTELHPQLSRFSWLQTNHITSVTKCHRGSREHWNYTINSFNGAQTLVLSGAQLRTIVWFLYISICLKEFYRNHTVTLQQSQNNCQMYDVIFPPNTFKIETQKSYDYLELKCLSCCKAWAPMNEARKSYTWRAVSKLTLARRGSIPEGQNLWTAFL